MNFDPNLMCEKGFSRPNEQNLGCPALKSDWNHHDHGNGALHVELTIGQCAARELAS
jgi:hypothetical protein